MSNGIMKPIRNRDWARQAFMVTKEEMKDIPKILRNYHTAMIKYVDGTPGGNICINPLPQPSLYADPPPDGNYSLRQGSSGMGSYYSEIFDDNKQVIHMRFGVPAYNSLTSWLKGFYSAQAGRLARTGRAVGPLYYLGRGAGFVVSLIFWPIAAANLIWRAAKFFLNKPSSKFYYLKPAMVQYWSVVQTIVNHIAVNMGLTVENADPDKQPKLMEDYTKDPATNYAIHKAYPMIVKPNGYIDVFQLAGRAQRLSNKQDRMLINLEQGAAYGDMAQLEQRLYSIYTTKMTMDLDGGLTYQQYLDSWLSTQVSDPERGDDPAGEAVDVTYDDEGFFRFLQGEWDDGTAFSSFRVNYTGSVSESFSNDFKSSEIGDKINSIAAQNRSKWFDFSGGNIGDGPVSDLVETAVSGLNDIITGVGEQLGVQGLAVLGGAAYADVPKHWDSSSTSLPSSNYTMDLISPSGDVPSIIVNIIIPMAMLLAGAAPLSTGKHSHTAPFLCEYYDLGRCQTRLGMIKNLSIERGAATNIGFNQRGHALSYRMSFSIENLEPIMALPIVEGFKLTDTIAAGLVSGAAQIITGSESLSNDLGAAVLGGIFDDDTLFSDYMAILGATPLRNQIYQLPKLKKRLALNTYRREQGKSKAYWASVAGDATSIITAFHRGNDRLGVNL